MGLSPDAATPHRRAPLTRAVPCIGVLLFTALLLTPEPVSAQRRLTDDDVARILPMLKSPFGRTARARSAAARGEAGVNDYMSLTREASQPGFDAQAWLAARVDAAVPPGARYLRDCSRELPIAAVKVALPGGGLNSDVFTATAVHALGGGVQAAQDFYAGRGFTPVRGGTPATVRLLARDSSILVTISRSNPHGGEPLLRPACSRDAGPTVQLALFRPSWSESDRGWTPQRYEAELARHGLEHREYWDIVHGLRAARLLARSPEWREWGAEERNLFPNVPVYLRHAATLDPLLDLLEDEPIDR